MNLWWLCLAVSIVGKYRKKDLYIGKEKPECRIFPRKNYFKHIDWRSEPGSLDQNGERKCHILLKQMVASSSSFLSNEPDTGIQCFFFREQRIQTACARSW
jgi:hypothetical protein